MYFHEDMLQKVRADASLKFWEREVAAEVARAAQGSSQAGSMLAALGMGVSQEEAEAIADRLAASDFKDFLERAPGIEPYYRHRQESINGYLEEVISNVNAHEEQIAQQLLGGKRPERVISMSQASFTYRGARSVLIITTDAGKFLYKPHTMGYNQVFNQLCESLLPGKVHVPCAIDCGNACLCEFVESAPPANDQERSAYYEGLGGYLALAYFLSLIDQHANNILPVGPKLSPIDVETLLLASPAIQGSAPEPDDPALCIRSSIAFTGMLSYRHDRLVGSLVAGTKGKGIAPIRTSTEAIDHLDVMAKGFSDAFRRCLRSKQMICDAIRSLEDVDLRILMGPGSFYQGLQWRFFSLAEWDEASRLRDMNDILRTTRFKKTNEAVCHHELAVLVEHDIPYFTVKAGGRDLQADGELIWKDYLAESLVETAIRHVQQADEADLQWQLGLLRKLVQGMPLMSKSRVPDIQPKAEPLSADDALQEAGWILHRLIDELVECGHGGQAIMAFGNADGSYGPMDASFGWGYAGVGVFAAACQCLGVGDPNQTWWLVGLCLNEIARNGRYLSLCPEALLTAEALNLNTGIAGQLRALQLMWCATHHHKVQSVYANLLALLDIADFSNASDPAVLTALNQLENVLALAVPELSKCHHFVRTASAVANQAAEDGGDNLASFGAEEKSAANEAVPSLQNCDDLIDGNAGAVEHLVESGQIGLAGKLLAAMVARRRQTHNYIHKGAWRVPYFDPTLYHGATGVGYVLLRYAKPEAIEPLFPE